MSDNERARGGASYGGQAYWADTGPSNSYPENQGGRRDSDYGGCAREAGIVSSSYGRLGHSGQSQPGAAPGDGGTSTGRLSGGGWLGGSRRNPSPSRSYEVEELVDEERTGGAGYRGPRMIKGRPYGGGSGSGEGRC